MHSKQYAIREMISEGENTGSGLKQYPELLQKLLIYRGLTDPEEIAEFLNPDYETGLHDPYLMKDMDTVVERVLRAVSNNEKILIYSDYDADGIPAAVIMHDYFTGIGYKNFEVYIPHRHNEGFGLHLEAVDKFKEAGVKLLITLDCGITDIEEVEHATNAGIDVIITDHHMPLQKDGKDFLPPAYAVINPKRSDCDYPYDMLCGSGVAFKLVQALLLKNRFGLKEGAEKWFLDMAGLATLSDMVPLTGENRVFAHYGLKVLRKSKRPGFIHLLRKMNTKQAYITEDDIGFMITPRINAASRMGVPLDAFHLLSTKDEIIGSQYAAHLDAINNERKGLVASLVKEIKKVLHEREEHYKDKKIIVLGNPDWRPALLGLVANSIAEEYGKPVFLWGREDGKYIKGSCRSDGRTDLTKIMGLAQKSLVDFGGHKLSGGFSVDHEKIHELEDALLKAGLECMSEEKNENEQLPIDAKLSLNDVTWKTYNEIEQLAPFGIGNPKPVFLFENISVVSVKQFGKAKEHLELTFKNSNERPIKAIAFLQSQKIFRESQK
jgi:single-stranded-DNA-specific exonuclease